MVIDSHTHWTPPALLNALERRDTYPCITRKDDTRYIELREGNPIPLADDMWNEDVKLQKMDHVGIDASVLSVVGGTAIIDWLENDDAVSVARDANEELADLTRRYPTRFDGLAALPMFAGGKAVEELEHAVRVGLKGAMVYSNVRGRTLDDSAFRPIFAAAAELGVPIQIHPTDPLSQPWLESNALTTGIGFLFDTTTAAMRLIYAGIFEELPELKLMVPHAGSLLPFILGRIDHQAETFPEDGERLTMRPSEYVRLLYTDTICLWPSALHLTLEVFGPEHVMFGTDDPYWEQKPAIDTLRALDLSSEDTEQVTSQTSTGFFGLNGHGSQL